MSDPCHHSESPLVAQARKILDGESAKIGEVLVLVGELTKLKAFRWARKLLVFQARKTLQDESLSSGCELNLVKALRDANEFGYARKVLAHLRTSAAFPKDAARKVDLAQKHANCTYKDRDLPAARRLRDALRILEQELNLETTRDQETLGLAGAIHKRKWELDLNPTHLERSLGYYLRGYRIGVPGNDYGYTSINAAYVLDQLAALEARERPTGTGEDQQLTQRRQLASQIRNEIAAALQPMADQNPPPDVTGRWWFHATLAEAYFGLGEYAKSLTTLERGRSLAPPAPWEEESTLRQLASLALIQAERDGRKAGDILEGSQAWLTLKKYLKDNDAGVRTVFAGKVGLALSGGGFRASLFHIGVLARLAELDMLRHVEVLSCVSGGSILGAHYYLEVRHLLKTKRDKDIDRQDYIDIVDRVARNFLAGVQRNIRTRVAGSLLANLKMIVVGKYSRTERVGDLYESEIYAKVKDGKENGPRWLQDQTVRPLGEEEGFNPKYENWRRHAKVPILVLNATSLNTGHNWQFTASWMGEPPQSGNASTDIDANERLRRLYHEDTPPGFPPVRLGHAVAASACVPGLFDPIVLSGLYPDRTVRLVDGGVHDNQGTAGLLEADCTVLLVSDASGQMSSEPHPSNSVIGVPLRTNSILMARVREAEYNELDSRRQAGLLRGLMFLHLKKDLEAPPRSWIDCEDPEESPAKKPSDDEPTSYTVSRHVQALLAGIRTDLDSFSDAEAFALMTSGYRMTEHGFIASVPTFPEREPTKRAAWSFLEIEAAMKDSDDPSAAQKDLRGLLKVGSQLAFKIWLIEKILRYSAMAVAGIFVTALVVLTVRYWSDPMSLTIRTPWFAPKEFPFPMSYFGTAALVFLGGLVVGKRWMGVIRYRDTLERWLIGAGMSLAGWLLARVHLWVFDPWFLRRGRIDRFRK